ncbi:MAG: hypothetical protein Ta2G_14870 [Termitinemataceae bacterium]|nr:MAG: hypothetical protein Ta2G_14870 [Termitinemataceae bacterium]
MSKKKSSSIIFAAYIFLLTSACHTENAKGNLQDAVNDDIVAPPAVQFYSFASLIQTIPAAQNEFGDYLMPEFVDSNGLTYLMKSGYKFIDWAAQRDSFGNGIGDTIAAGDIIVLDEKGYKTVNARWERDASEPPPTPPDGGLEGEDVTGTEGEAGTEGVTGTEIETEGESISAGAEDQKKPDKKSEKKPDKKPVIDPKLDEPVFLAGEAQWYISNAAGMTMEKSFPLRALRSKNAVAVKKITGDQLPKELRKYYLDPWQILLSILYENGKRVKTQWVFKDESDLSLFVASIGNDGAGFIEWYNDEGLIVEEQRLEGDGSGFFVSYSYKNGFLLKADAYIVAAVIVPQEGEDQDGEGTKEGEGEAENEKVADVDADIVPDPEDDTQIAELLEPVEKASELAKKPQGPAKIPDFFVARSGREGPLAWSDSYRYTRTATLRLIERNVSADQNEESVYSSHLARFPRTVPLDVLGEGSNATISSTPLDASFLQDITLDQSAKIIYKTDHKRRVLTETRTNEEGEIIGELVYNWEGDKLGSVEWKATGDERRVEYAYNRKGERIDEKDYRNGVLERSVVVVENQEIETLYIDGDEVLRAVWEDGRKISEERLRSKRTN